MHIQSSAKMPLITDEKTNYLVVFDEKEVTKDDVTMYEYEGLRIDKGVGYSNLVSILVKEKYPSDEMDAVRNNYDLVRDGTAGAKAEEYTAEYLKMQSWRAEAKRIANEIVGLDKGKAYDKAGDI